MKILKRILKWIGIVLGGLLLIFLVLLVIPESETVKPIEPRANTSYWEMEEGFKIAYTHLENEGDSAKHPVIFLHGGPGGYVHSSIINTLGELTSHGHDVYLYDQRGSGLSDRLEKYSDVTFKKHISDLDEIVSEKIGTEKVILIGQSFGCNIIAHYAVERPDKVEKIVFGSPGTLRPYRKIEGRYADLDSLYPVPDSLDFVEPYDFVKDVDNMAMKPKAIAATLGALLFDKKWVSDKQMDRMLNTLASQFTKGMVCDPANVSPEEGGGGLYAYIATNSSDFPEIRSEIDRVTAPVMVMQGQCEYHPFSTGYEYVDLFPNARYVFIEDAGHEIWWEQPEVFMERIVAFLLE